MATDAIMRTCFGCGCTDDCACLPPCWWPSPFIDLCSTCHAKPAACIDDGCTEDFHHLTFGCSWAPGTGELWLEATDDGPRWSPRFIAIIGALIVAACIGLVIIAIANRTPS
jgi:hypothetical protein